MSKFDLNYEVCNCKKVCVNDIKNCVEKENITTLMQLQEKTHAGTECRHCIFQETDFGKIKKSVYCKEVLDYFLKEKDNG